MIARALGVVVALLAVVAQPASAAQPIGDWKIEPSEARCIAVRQYGSASKPITLALKASPTESTYQLAILRPGYRKGQLQTNARLEFDGKSFTVSTLSYPVANRRITHLINLDADQAAALRTAKAMKVAVEEGLDDDFLLGPLSQATLAGLNSCVERLLITWNVGEERQARLSEGPKANLQATSVVGSDDYPNMAQRLDQQGTARFLILIDEKGMPRECSLIQTSGSALLDSRSCGVIMERARFTPAVDQSGKPAKSSHIQGMTWRLED